MEQTSSIEQQKPVILTITSPKGSYYPKITETIEWPIINKTEKAILVQTIGGDLWIPAWKLPDIRGGFHADSATRLVDHITNISSKGSDHVTVVHAGPGPSGKSAKYKVKVKRMVADENFEHPVAKIVERTFTLAKSQNVFVLLSSDD